MPERSCRSFRPGPWFLGPGSCPLTVSCCPHPFEQRRVDYAVPAGLTIAEIVERIEWALAALQIAEHKDQPLLGNEAGLVMYLKADESSGETLADASGHGHAGEIVHLWANTSGVVAVETPVVNSEAVKTCLLYTSPSPRD